MNLGTNTLPAIGLAAMLLLGISPVADVAHSATIPVVSTLSAITEGVSTPVRLAADQLGNIYVTDPRGGGIHKYNSAGKLQQLITATKDILGIAIAQNGNLLVSQGTSVLVLDKNSGALVSRFGSFGKANGIAVDSSGFIYVVDSLDNCVQVFNAAYAPVSTGVAAAGKPANSFGSVGTNVGQFMQPTGISYEKISRQLAVVDTFNGRVQFFSTAGVYQKSLGSYGAGPLMFSSPQGIAFEYTKDDKALSRIYVVDSYQSNVQVIDGATNTFLRYIGSYGITSGKLLVPADVLYDRFDFLNNRLVVANGTGVVSLFGIDSSSTSSSSGPALTINSVPLVTNLSSLVINGTTSNGASVTVNGTAAAVTGTFWTSTINLNTGINIIQVAANATSGTTVETVSVNVLPGDSGLAPVSLTMNPVPTITGNSLVTLAGSITDGAAVSVNGIAATAAGTTWSQQVTLSPGVNNFLIKGSKAGLGDSTTSFNITMDNTPPVLNTFLLQSGSSTSTQVQTISGTVADTTAASVTVAVNDTTQTVPVSDGLFSLAIILRSGANTVSVTAVDAAGNPSTPVKSIITYDPLAPVVALSTPNGAVTGSSSYTLRGTASAGSIVTVNNGSPVPLNGTAWSTTVTLSSGLNFLEIKAEDPTSGRTSSIVGSIIYGQGVPSIAVTSPPQDRATALPANILTGSVAQGATVSAAVNGVAVPVVVSGTLFTVTLPTFTVPGTYSVAVSAADNFGATSTSIRTLIYDTTAPVITVVSVTPPKVTATGGTLAAEDKNGPVGTVTVSGGTSSLDLTGVNFDPATLNIYAISTAGASSRNGDLNLDGKIDVADALLALQVLVGIVPPPSFEQMLHGDVAPLVNHVPTPDGKIGLEDALAILSKAIGLTW